MQQRILIAGCSLVMMASGACGSATPTPINAANHAPETAQPAPGTPRIPPDQIQSAVRAKRADMQACYDKGGAKNPDLRGSVVASFTIGLDGNVTSLTTSESTLPDQQVVDCIADIFRGLQFPKPEGGVVTVKYPINLSPDGPEGR